MELFYFVTKFAPEIGHCGLNSLNQLPMTLTKKVLNNFIPERKVMVETKALYSVNMIYIWSKKKNHQRGKIEFL